MGVIDAALVLRAYVATLEFINNAPPEMRAKHYARLDAIGDLFDHVAGDIKAAVALVVRST